MRILTVNGIESDGSSTTDLLGDELRTGGYEVIDINQPIRHAWNARWTSDRDTTDILAIAKHGDVIVAHSYGCLKAAIANEAINFAAMFLFRPAMSTWYKFPRYQTTRLYCIYSKQDISIVLGGLLRFNHPFGLAGYRGFRSPYVCNIESQGAHSSDFKEFNRKKWATYIKTELHSIGASP